MSGPHSKTHIVLDVPAGAFPAPDDTTPITVDDCPVIPAPSGSCSCDGDSVLYWDQFDVLDNDGRFTIVCYDVVLECGGVVKATMTGQGTMTCTVLVHVIEGALLTGIGDMILQQPGAVAPVLTGQGDMIATVRVAVQPQAVLTGIGDMSAMPIFNPALLPGVGSMTAVTTVRKMAVSLTGYGDMSWNVMRTVSIGAAREDVPSLTGVYRIYGTTTFDDIFTLPIESPVTHEVIRSYSTNSSFWDNQTYNAHVGDPFTGKVWAATVDYDVDFFNWLRWIGVEQQDSGQLAQLNDYNHVFRGVLAPNGKLYFVTADFDTYDPIEVYAVNEWDPTTNTLTVLWDTYIDGPLDPGGVAATNINWITADDQRLYLYGGKSGPTVRCFMTMGFDGTDNADAFVVTPSLNNITTGTYQGSKYVWGVKAVTDELFRWDYPGWGNETSYDFTADSIDMWRGLCYDEVNEKVYMTESRNRLVEQTQIWRCNGDGTGIEQFFQLTNYWNDSTNRQEWVQIGDDLSITNVKGNSTVHGQGGMSVTADVIKNVSSAISGGDAAAYGAKMKARVIAYPDDGEARGNLFNESGMTAVTAVHGIYFRYDIQRINSDDPWWWNATEGIFINHTPTINMAVDSVQNWRHAYITCRPEYNLTEIQFTVTEAPIGEDEDWVVSIEYFTAGAWVESMAGMSKWGAGPQLSHPVATYSIPGGHVSNQWRIKWTTVQDSPIDFHMIFSATDNEGFSATDTYELTYADPPYKGVLSDVNAKKDINETDPAHVLERLSRVPVSTWRYKDLDGEVLHMGPMAQDFYAAFGLGGNDKRIATVDSDGVALAAIQGLYKLVQELQEDNAKLREDMERLKQ